MNTELNHYLNMVVENVGISKEILMEELDKLGSELSPKEREVYQTGYVQGIFEGWFFAQGKMLPQ